MNQNLAETLDPAYIDGLGNELRQRTEDEYNARHGFLEIIRSSLSALGLTQYYQQNRSNTKNESTIVDAAFLQTWIQLKNEFTAELFPVFKVATTDIPNRNLINALPDGNKLLEKLDNFAQIIEEDINNKINIEWSDWLPELEKAIGSAFLTGSSVCKVYLDPVMGRPVVRMIPPQNILISENESSLESARWIGHIYTLTEQELNIYQAKGIFRTVALSPDNDGESTSETQSVTNLERQVSGMEDITKTSDRVKKYVFVEVQFWDCYSENGDPEIEGDTPEANFIYYPYTAHIHKESGTVMSLDPAWEIVNGEILKKQTMFKFTFLEGFDFWGMGLAQTCIGLHNTATTVLRNLNKSLTLANAQTLILGNNLTPQQSNIDLNYGGITCIAAPTQDIKESLVKLEFDQPSPMYVEFLQSLRDLIQRIAGISSVRFDNMPANIQGNFLLALMDKETKPMSVVLQHFQFSINQMFLILKRLLRTELTNKQIVPGLPMTYGEVYSPYINIISALDPSMSNSASQLIRMQTLLDSALQSPQLHNLTKVYERLYRIMKIDNIAELLIPEDVLQQQQQQAQQEAQAQAQAQAQTAQQQNELLMTDIQNKHQINLQDMELKTQKLTNELELSLKKLEVQMQLAEDKLNFEFLKEKGEVTKQQNIEEAQIFESKNRFNIEKAKLESESGIDVPVEPEPVLTSYEIDEIPL